MHITKVWIDDCYIYATTDNGDTAKYSFEEWPALAGATEEQLKNFTLSHTGIHWPELDEDLSFEGMFIDNGMATATVNEDSVCYEKTPCK